MKVMIFTMDQEFARKMMPNSYGNTNYRAKIGTTSNRYIEAPIALEDELILGVLEILQEQEILKDWQPSRTSNP